MTEKQKKLLEALWTIKNECNGTECGNCPFRKLKTESVFEQCGLCGLYPSNWDLKSLGDDEKPWSAFN